MIQIHHKQVQVQICHNQVQVILKAPLEVQSLEILAKEISVLDLELPLITLVR